MMERFRVVHELGGWLRYVVRWRDLGWRTGWLAESWVCGAMERFRVVHGLGGWLRVEYVV